MFNKIQLRQSDIIEVFEVCPYCNQPRHNKFSCCSEIHFCKGYLTNKDEILTEDEVIIID